MPSGRPGQDELPEALAAPPTAPAPTSGSVELRVLTRLADSTSFCSLRRNFKLLHENSMLMTGKRSKPPKPLSRPAFHGGGRGSYGRLGGWGSLLPALLAIATY